MAFKSYRDSSRVNYGTNDDAKSLTLEQINTGSLLRIADATELMAKNHIQLQNDLDWYKKRYPEQREEIAHLNNRIRSLKGVITRLKKS